MTEKVDRSLQWAAQPEVPVECWIRVCHQRPLPSDTLVEYLLATRQAEKYLRGWRYSLLQHFQWIGYCRDTETASRILRVVVRHIKKAPLLGTARETRELVEAFFSGLQATRCPVDGQFYLMRYLNRELPEIFGLGRLLHYCQEVALVGGLLDLEAAPAAAAAAENAVYSRLADPPNVRRRCGHQQWEGAPRSCECRRQELLVLRALCVRAGRSPLLDGRALTVMSSSDGVWPGDIYNTGGLRAGLYRGDFLLRLLLLAVECGLRAEEYLTEEWLGKQVDPRSGDPLTDASINALLEILKAESPSGGSRYLVCLFRGAMSRGSFAAAERLLRWVASREAESLRGYLSAYFNTEHSPSPVPTLWLCRRTASHSRLSLVDFLASRLPEVAADLLTCHTMPLPRNLRSVALLHLPACPREQAALLRGHGGAGTNRRLFAALQAVLCTEEPVLSAARLIVGVLRNADADAESRGALATDLLVRLLRGPWVQGMARRPDARHFVLHGLLPVVGDGVSTARLSGALPNRRWPAFGCEIIRSVYMRGLDRLSRVFPGRLVRHISDFVVPQQKGRV